MSYAMEYGNHQQTFKIESAIVINDENTNILVPGQKAKVLHKCDHCDACSPQKLIIKRHIGLVHERKPPLECMDCYAVFVEQKQLTKHKRKQHSNSMPFQCGVCKAGFTEKGAVNRHIANVHEGKKSHVCEICQKTFTERGIMERHVKYVHEKIKDYKCPYCVKEFGGRGNLNIHVRTVHEGIKPHKCPVCQVAYVDKRAMQKHVDSVHRGIIQKDFEKFQCSQCESKFSTKYTLRAHVESIHDNIRPLGLDFVLSFLSVLSNFRSREKLSKKRLESKPEQFARIQIFSGTIDQNPYFSIAILVLDYKVLFTNFHLMVLLIFGSLVRENSRGFIENMKHKILTLRVLTL